MDKQFNLCNICIKPVKNKCSLYRKNPNATVADCGNFEPDRTKTSFGEAAVEIIKRTGGR